MRRRRRILVRRAHDPTGATVNRCADPLVGTIPIWRACSRTIRTPIDAVRRCVGPRTPLAIRCSERVAPRSGRDPRHATGRAGRVSTLGAMADSLDVDAMINRFRERAAAVKKRNLPPVAGEERQRFLKQAQEDFMDFAIIGDAQASLEDGVLVLRVDLRPADQRN